MTEDASDFDASCAPAECGAVRMSSGMHPQLASHGLGSEVAGCRRRYVRPSRLPVGVRWPRQRWRSRLLVPPWDPYGSDRRLACPFRRGARHETNDALGLGPAGPDRRWGRGAAARLLPRSPRTVAGAAEPGPGRVPELGRAADGAAPGAPAPASPPRAGGRARGAAAGATAAAITGNDAGKGAAAGAVGGAAAQRGARRQDPRAGDGAAAASRRGLRQGNGGLHAGTGLHRRMTPACAHPRAAMTRASASACGTGKAPNVRQPARGDAHNPRSARSPSR